MRDLSEVDVMGPDAGMKSTRNTFVYGPDERRDFFRTKPVRTHYIKQKLQDGTLTEAALAPVDRRVSVAVKSMAPDQHRELASTLQSFKPDNSLLHQTPEHAA